MSMQDPISDLLTRIRNAQAAKKVVVMVPFSKLDGTQIYFGSRVLWSILAVMTLICTMYALLLV